MTGLEIQARLAPWLATGSPFAETVTFGATTFRAMVRRTGTAEGEVVTPTLTLPLANLPTGFGQGSTVTVGGVSYPVDGIERNGYGFALVNLRPRIAT